ncbi:centromere/kinetochore protein-like protein zw10 [Hyaloscypha variabilis F]|uniref:Centromere/kinetochore protein-like protein zw10 n=1 Tax=Hyaloscypha variabilis (strain UAMH 11265 / GT02V1 / F) TaxID=1149755 RepID=A0A2J6R7M9_HYAVF|nr:centromere/kinetochore protein-like protein zw10 [Hyaloscypha variabilis F]
MASAEVQDRLGQVLINFTTNGAFPEEESVSAAYVQKPYLAPALEALSAARSELETEIRQISRESAPNVDKWIEHAKSIQDDIDRSRRLASSIVRQAEADDETEESLQENEKYVEFLTKEVSFNGQLLSALKGIQGVKEILQQAEDLAEEKKIVEALFKLEAAWTAISHLPLEKTVRAVRILDSKCFDQHRHIYEQFTNVWNGLVNVDLKQRSITINKNSPDQGTDLEQAIIGLKAFKELDKAAERLWLDLDDTILKPRTNLPLDGKVGSLFTIQVEKNRLSRGGETTDHSIKSLFVDLETIIRFLVDNLPYEFIESLSKAMMPTLARRILEVWLDTAVPSSLEDMVDYQKALAQVHEFAKNLDALKWAGVESLHDWVTNAPKIWLTKKRESALDWTRNQFSLGLGVPQIAERVEKRMVAREEKENIITTGTAVTQDWDAAWESDGEAKEDNSSEARNRHSLDEERKASEVFTPEEVDDAADAWGWGDDDAADPEPEPRPANVPGDEKLSAVTQNLAPEVREMIISEKYWTTSLPKPVYQTVTTIYEEGAKLTQPETSQIPISPAAPGLFSLPTLILAMYRSVSPLYYTDEPGGNMFLYNDAIWLSEKLKDFASEWKNREDLPPRAYGMVRLDPEVKVLESFGKRAYTNELNAQRTVINDLLAGAQNFFQQGDEAHQSISDVTRHIRTQAALWEKILPYSAWASATGSLVNAVATKLISDVFDLTDMSVDEAERAATLISRVELLDDLFIPKNETGQPSVDGTPLTSQFADKWMKMKFLSEVLQSNLKDVKFLWFESDLSFYFTAEEVVDLINLSFESNTGMRAAIREIRENPHPRPEGE